MVKKATKKAAKKKATKKVAKKATKKKAAKKRQFAPLVKGSFGALFFCLFFNFPSENLLFQNKHRTRLGHDNGPNITQFDGRNRE